MLTDKKCNSVLLEPKDVTPSEAAFEGGKWGDRPRPRSWGGPTLQAFMNNEKTKFVRQVAKVDLV